MYLFTFLVGRYAGIVVFFFFSFFFFRVRKRERNAEEKERQGRKVMGKGGNEELKAGMG